VILSQPQDAVLNQGEHLELFAIAEGEELVYQWQQDGINIVGAIALTYKKDNVQLHDAGNYRIIVTGEYGVDTSEVAKVIVSPTEIKEHGVVQIALVSVVLNPFNCPD
jgi:hypothetical protein